TVPAGPVTIPVTVTYPDGSTEVIDVVVTVGTTDAVDNAPDYVDTTVEPGATVTIAPPVNASGVALPTGTTFAPGAVVPAWATVNPDGSITVNPDATVPTGPVTIPVTVTYPDGSTEVIDVVVTVGTTDAVDLAPDYVDTTVKPGTTVTIPAPTDASGKVIPAGTTYAPADAATLPAWVKVNPDGTITVNPDVTVPAGPVTIPVTVTYPDGSTEVIDVVVSVGTTDAVNNAPDYVDTTVEPGATVTIAPPVNASGVALPTGTTFAPGAGVPAWATVNPDGSITVKPDATVPAGPVTIPVTVTYPDGTTDVIDVVVTVGTTDAVDNAPDYVDTAVAQGTSATIAAPVNADGTALPTGTTFTPGAGVPAWATVNPDGTITVNPGATVPAGPVTIPVTVTYPDGSTEVINVVVTVTDQTAPVVDVNPVKAGDTTVGGTSEPGSTITVTLPDGTKVSTVTQPDGTWTVTVPALKEGDVVSAVSTDAAGNVSQPSSETAPTTPVVDTTPPAAPPVNPVTSEDPAVTGIGVPGNTITVTFPDGTKGTAVVQPDGTWTVPVPAGVDLVGGEVLPVTSTDPAGNVSPETKVTVSDVTPPAAPPVNPVTSEDTAVTGTGTPGDTITVKFPNGSTGTAVVKPDGTWSVTIPTGVDLVGGEVLPVTETDPAGNVSPATSVTVTDTTGPAAPTVRPVTSEDTAVTGIGVPGNTITVTFPDGTKG
ncbi:Rib/alpha-like domain-containing protein, partial [Macrococcus capreoli]|uniref:Rib/alpha-like domain-containing protein n=1 Tax=Macrococcus capreoli TaxID=2982690 RepID=UPI0021D58144